MYGGLSLVVDGIGSFGVGGGVSLVVVAIGSFGVGDVGGVGGSYIGGFCRAE